MISKALGIEGKQLLTPEDDYAALKEFNQAYEGTKTTIEEMHLEEPDLECIPPVVWRCDEAFGYSPSLGKQPGMQCTRALYVGHLPEVPSRTTRVAQARTPELHHVSG